MILRTIILILLFVGSYDNWSQVRTVRSVPLNYTIDLADPLKQAKSDVKKAKGKPKEVRKKLKKDAKEKLRQEKQKRLGLNRLYANKLDSLRGIREAKVKNSIKNKAQEYVANGQNTDLESLPISNKDKKRLKRLKDAYGQYDFLGNAESRDSIALTKAGQQTKAVLGKQNEFNKLNAEVLENAEQLGFADSIGSFNLWDKIKSEEDSIVLKKAKQKWNEVVKDHEDLNKSRRKVHQETKGIKQPDSTNLKKLKRWKGNKKTAVEKLKASKEIKKLKKKLIKNDLLDSALFNPTKGFDKTELDSLISWSNDSTKSAAERYVNQYTGVATRAYESKLNKELGGGEWAKNLPQSNSDLGNARNALTPKEIENLRSMRQGKLDRTALDEYKKPYVDHFAGKEEQLDKAALVLEKARKKKSNMDVVKDILDQDTASHKQKNFKEKLDFGGFVTFTNREGLGIIASPFVSYALTGKFSVGIGGYYERSSDKKAIGYMTFLQYRLPRSFFLHSEYQFIDGQIEQQNAISSAFDFQTDTYFVGLGRTLDIKNGFKSNILLLYRLGEDHRSNRWDLRVGFSF